MDDDIIELQRAAKCQAAQGSGRGPEEERPRCQRALLQIANHGRGNIRPAIVTDKLQVVRVCVHVSVGLRVCACEGIGVEACVHVSA